MVLCLCVLCLCYSVFQKVSLILEYFIGEIFCGGGWGLGRKELKSITHCDDFNGNSNAVSLLFRFLKPDMGALTGDVYNRKSAKNICYSVSSLLRS